MHLDYVNHPVTITVLATWLRISYACMPTKTSSEVTTSTCSLGLSCTNQLANTANIVLQVTTAELTGNPGLVGTCGCAGNNGPIESVYTAFGDIDPADIPSGPIVLCPTQQQLCVCDVNCECYAAYGDIYNADPLNAHVGTAAACDSSGCFMYLAPACVLNAPPDPNSGLVNLVTGQKLSCAAPVLQNGDLVPVGPSSPYIKAFYVGCAGCPTAGNSVISLCNGHTPGTFTATAAG